MPGRSLALCSAALAALLAARAEAHHSFAVFDRSRALEIRGVVVELRLRNPHSSLVVDGRAFVDGEPQSDAAERWEIEADASAAMQTSGIADETFRPGDPIVVTASPHRERPRFAKASVLEAADGSRFELGFRGSSRVFSPSLRRALRLDPAQDAAPAGPGTAPLERIAGRWQQPGASLAPFAPLELTDGGRAARDAYDPKRSPANDCEPMNVPELFNAPFFLVDVTLEEGRAVFRHELYDVERTLPLDGTTIPASADPRFGSVTGRVDGDTLVVESRGYPPSRWGVAVATQLGAGADVPSSAGKSLTERYSVSADGSTLVLEYTLSDPTYLAAPYEGRVELTRVPDGTPMYSYDCDPESAAMWSRGPRD